MYKIVTKLQVYFVWEHEILLSDPLACTLMHSSSCNNLNELYQVNQNCLITVLIYHGVFICRDCFEWHISNSAPNFTLGNAERPFEAAMNRNPLR